MSASRIRPALLVPAVLAAACSTKPAAQTTVPAAASAPTVVRLEPTPAPPPAAARPAEEALPAVEEINRRGYLKDAFFPYDDAAVEPDQRGALAKDAAWLRSHPSVTVRVEGYCDERGTASYNLALGERRAASVREYLAAAGVKDSRIAILSYGKEHPFATGHDEASWSQNRRGHFVATGE